MAKAKKRLENIRDEVEDLQEQFSQANSTQKKSLGKGTWTMISAALTLIGLYVGILIVPTLSVSDLITGHQNLALGILLLYGALIYVSGESGRTFSFPFALITVAVGVALWSFMPSAVTTALSPERILGVELPPINGVTFLIMSVAVAALYWAVTIRVTGRAKKPEKIADRVVKKFAKVVDTYASILAVIGLGGIYLGYVALSNGGQLIGQVGDILALEPFLSSDVFTIAVGYLSFGGELPVVGEVPFLQSLGPTGWLFLAGGGLLLAVAAYYSASGPTSRLFR